MLASTKLLLVVLCVAMVGLNSISANPLADTKPELAKPKPPTQSDDERLPIGPDGSLFLSGIECGKDEELAPGQPPNCEPTCNDPKPICTKIFFSSLDYVPCFCKAPLVRNLQTKQCVPLSECPPRSKPLEPAQIRW